MKTIRLFSAIFCWLGWTLPVFAAQTGQKPRVAVFSQPGFPYYNVSTLVSPKTIAQDLSAANIPTDLLDAAALADPARCNAKAYAAVVLPYGNVYPQAAFATLKAFHQAGGCLILSGVPFTHAVRRAGNRGWRDLGHNGDAAQFGPDGIGVGSFVDGPSGEVAAAVGDPLGLAALGLNWGNGENTQVLDTAMLPAEDTLVPILTAGDKPVATLLLHHDAAFNGAVDVWTTNSLRVDEMVAAYAETQLMVRGALAALTQKGLLATAQEKTAFVMLAKLPKPRVFTDLTLPTPPRPYPTLQPKMPPPAEHLYVADVSKLPHDQILLLASLQGIVNRTQPRIYLITHEDDSFWLEQMQNQKQTGKPIPVSDPFSLFRTFRSAIHGAVVPDPKVYVSPCIAVDIAGIEDLVIATPALARQLHLPIKSDLRGKFKDDADAYRYVRTTLMPHLNPYLATTLDPPILGSQVDDVIAARGMCFWVTGPRAQDRPGANEQAERTEIEATLAQMPLDAVVRGFWWHGGGTGLDEGPGVALGSRFGKITTVSDYVANFSVTSGLRLPAMKQKPQPPAPQLDSGKVYLAITVSDGDNLCTWRGYFRQYFTDPLHGTFPVAFGMGPTLIDLAPDQVQWYYDHAAPTDEFLCDVSGVGYIYPPDWAVALKNRSDAFRSFYDWTEKYMKRMDMHTIRLMNVGVQDIARVGATLSDVAFLMPDYGYSGEQSYDAMTYTLPTGQAVFRSVCTGQGAQNLADQIRSRVGATRPAFVNAFIWNWGSKMSDLKQMLDILGPEYVAVTPSQLDALFKQAHPPTAPVQ